VKVEAVYKLLKKIRGVESTIGNPYRRVLKYIYEDVYDGSLKEKYNKIMLEVGDLKEGSLGYNRIFSNYRATSEVLSYVLDSNNSIVTYLNEMFDENKEDFVNLFFEKIDIYFDVVDNHFYTSDDFEIHSLAINIYCMLLAYHYHKDNFELYAKLLDDCSDLLCWPQNMGDSRNFIYKLDEIKEIIRCKAYLDVELVRTILKQKLSSFSSSFYAADAQKVKYEVDMANQIKEDYDDLKNIGMGHKLLSLDDVISGCALNKGNLRDCSYYCKSLLIGDRLKYINEKINLAFPDKKHQENVMDDIKKINFELFEYLNDLNQGEDSFISCFEIVFDSDTYTEFLNKMKILTDSSSDFSRGYKPSYSGILDLLNDSQTKRKLDGVTLVFGKNTVNPLKKPASILERMIHIYKNFYHDDAIDVPSILRRNNNASLYGFNGVVENALKEERRRVNAIREVEKRRLLEIREELVEMGIVSDIASRNTGNNQEETVLATDSDRTVPEQNPVSRPNQKLKGFFGRKTNS